MALAAGILGPLIQPLADQPLDQSGRFSQAWTRHQQDVVDALSRVGVGVVDGSDAAAGQLGEYLEASFTTPVALIGAGTAVDIGTLSLTPGDWDVTGSTVFNTSGNNLYSVAAWVGTTSGALSDWGASAITTNIGTTRFGTGTRLLAGPKRFSLSVTTTLYLGALAGFPAGTADVRGHIGARRVR